MPAVLRPTVTVITALLLAGARPAAAQVIVGRVVDDTSGAAVARAIVTAVGPGRNGSRRTLTGTDGSFTLPVRAGRWRVRVARAGYGNAASGPVTVGAGDTARVTVRISPSAVPLARITATARPHRPPATGVYTPVTPTDSLLALPIQAEGGSRSVVVRGQMPTPTACYHLAGAAERVGHVITLAVQARPTGDECLAGFIGASKYKVTLRRIPAGTYTLRVVHAYRDNAWPPRVALDTPVTVR